MSSPQEAGTAAQGPTKHSNMPVSILFCPECSNMLYPKEDKDARRLMYQCRTCQHTEEATSNCVYRNILKNQAGDTAGVTQDVTHDPTVGDPSTSATSTCTTNNPPDPSSAPSPLVICGCCGQVIMCSDCGMHPAVVPTDQSTSHDASSVSSPPKMYQAELFGGMTAWTEDDDQDTWSRILDEVAELNIDPMDMDFDLDDEDMEDWEPEMEDSILVYGPPNRPISA
ncbi:hypothetical protein N0V82_000623 [Gnomoniopsis sp. IMI 355080]|nr:hypothetical protein N0V82_000623 [Gnomoniopsis sp. IMI 355080]